MKNYRNILTSILAVQIAFLPLAQAQTQSANEAAQREAILQSRYEESQQRLREETQRLSEQERRDSEVRAIRTERLAKRAERQGRIINLNHQIEVLEAAKTQLAEEYAREKLFTATYNDFTSPSGFTQWLLKAKGVSGNPHPSIGEFSLYTAALGFIVTIVSGQPGWSARAGETMTKVGVSILTIGVVAIISTTSLRAIFDEQSQMITVVENTEPQEVLAIVGKSQARVLEIEAELVEKDAEIKAIEAELETL